VSCLTITYDGAPEPEMRAKLLDPELNLDQEIYVSETLPQTARVMVKDEDICLHCGLCAERCPTAAWDMRRFELEISYAGRPACPSHA
jgi:NAD-dependent dihydropyrimidine dehydrogenase PreA subunit